MYVIPLFSWTICVLLVCTVICQDRSIERNLPVNGTKQEIPKESDLATSNPEEFELHLKGLSEGKNKRCESKALGAVLRALSTSQPRSYVFIFTNGPAKDYYLLSKVLEKIAEKQSQVVFVLGELCAAPGHVGYKVYERIAKLSSGQVLHISKKDTDLALKFVETAIQVNRVHLLSVDAKGSGTRSFTFLVDRHLKNILVSTVGKKHVQAKVKYPDGKKPKKSKITKIIKEPNMVVTKIGKPQEGMWNIVVKSTGNYSIRVTSESSFFIKFGFSTKKFDRKDEHFKLRRHPVLEATNYLYVSFIAMKNMSHIGLLKTVEILNLNGDKIKSIPIALDALLEDSFVIQLVPPKHPFLLRFIGVDDKGDFARVSPIVLQASLPDPPKITMKDRYIAYTGQDLVLHCYVESSVPFTVTWSKDKLPLDSPTQYIKSVNSSLWIPPKAFGGSNKFTCTARNIAGVASTTTTVNVKVSPPIIEEIGNKTALLSETVFLQCLAFSTEPIEIKWFRNDKEIETKDRFVITTDLQVAISNIQEEDGGWFRCVAENSGGKSVASFYLKVYEDPVVAIFPQVQVFREGEAMSFTCDTVGQFVPQITWLKDDTKIKESPRIDQSIGNELYIADTKETDQGKYECVANYSDVRPGVVLRSHAFAEFRTPPKAKITRLDQSVLVGSPVTLKCIATGNPEPTVSWNRNGQTVIENKRIKMSDRSLIILESKTTDTGSYSCVAQNTEGLDFASAHVLVGTKPVIKEEKVRRVEVKQTSNVTLQCTVNGIPDPYVYWIDKTGREIEKNNGVVRLSSGKLLIREMKQKYAGKYLCKAENQFGTAMAQIDVEIIGLEKPKIKSLDDPLIYGLIGNDVILPCEVSSGTKPKIKWVRRGGNFDLQSSRFQILANGSLLIKNVTREESATYVCKASNRIGQTKAERKLLVTIPPVWTLKPGELYELFEGEELRLECFASGIPRPQISWKHDGKLLANKEDFLVIREVEKNNSGDYQCDARNVGGNITAKTTVAVKDFVIVDVTSFELPGSIGINQPLEERQIDILRFVRLPEDRKIDPGSSHVFDCVASGDLKPTVTWQRSGVALSVPLDILPNNSLIIRDAREDDSGFYACVAENDRGKIMKDFTISVVVHGGFSQWTDWGPCSQSCDGGKQLRNRFCNSPTPRNGGRKCEGIYVQQRSCNQSPCIQEPGESQWSAWGPCSRSCDGGRQYRVRQCPSGTSDCQTGMQFDHRICNMFKCGGIVGITEVIGGITGEINGQDIGPVALMAQISYVDQFVKITLDVKNIPKRLLYTMRSVVSFLTPVYWSTVTQGRDGFNGISVAVGSFIYKGKIKYNDVQILTTECKVTFIPESQSLMMETSLSGDVQHFSRKGFSPQHCNEIFLQTSPSTILGYSERYILIEEASAKYKLEHSIVYASPRTLNYPSQTYQVKTDSLTVDEEKMSIRHEITASYVGGKDECPEGFLKDGKYCRDINECETLTRCEHLCINTNGSYHCACNKGFFLSRDGVTCADINECRQRLHNCKDHEMCINTRGGHQCKEKECPEGLSRNKQTLKCEDIDECTKKDICLEEQSCVNTLGSYNCLWNPCVDAGLKRLDNGSCVDRDECTENPGVCNPMQICENTVGSYRCAEREQCAVGFTRDAISMKCEDINECLLDVCKPSEFCMNTPGAFACFPQTCGDGYENIEGSCVDIDECTSKETCLADQTCINTDGSFICINSPCNAGYKRVNGSCKDIDECANSPSPCPDGSRCINLVPSFTCALTPCKVGYKYNSQKKECQDVDECKGVNDCKDEERCMNTIGSYNCVRICEPGMEMVGDGECIDIDECERGLHNCVTNKTCVNTAGSFICQKPTTQAPTTTKTTTTKPPTTTAFVPPTTSRATTTTEVKTTAEITTKGAVSTADPRSALIRVTTKEKETMAATGRLLQSTDRPASLEVDHAIINGGSVEVTTKEKPGVASSSNILSTEEPSAINEGKSGSTLIASTAASKVDVMTNKLATEEPSINNVIGMQTKDFMEVDTTAKPTKTATTVASVDLKTEQPIKPQTTIPGLLSVTTDSIPTADGVAHSTTQMEVDTATKEPDTKAVIEEYLNKLPTFTPQQGQQETTAPMIDMSTEVPFEPQTEHPVTVNMTLKLKVTSKPTATPTTGAPAVEVDGKKIEGKETQIGTKEPIGQSNTQSPALSATRDSSKPTTTMPTAVPLVTDDSNGFENFWELFGGFSPQPNGISTTQATTVAATSRGTAAVSGTSDASKGASVGTDESESQKGLITKTPDEDSNAKASSTSQGIVPEGSKGAVVSPVQPQEVIVAETPTGNSLMTDVLAGGDGVDITAGLGKITFAAAESTKEPPTEVSNLAITATGNGGNLLEGETEPPTSIDLNVVQATDPPKEVTDNLEQETATTAVAAIIETEAGATTLSPPVVVTTRVAPMETKAPATTLAPPIVVEETGAAPIETEAPTTKAAAPVVVTTEAAPIVTEEPTTKVAAPVVVTTEAAPVETEAPTSKAAAPVVVTTEAALVETEAPTTKAAPIETEAPTTKAAAPVETEAPTTKSAPVVVTTEAAPVETEAPTTKAAPVVVTTEAAPVETEAPTTKAAPVVVTTEVAPVETEAPTTKSSPVVVTSEAALVETEAPTTKAAPVVVTTEAAPVETEAPTTKAAPVVVTTEAAPVETEAPTTKAAPLVVTTEAAPVETEAPTTKAAPVVVTTEAAPVQTEAPTAKAVPVVVTTGAATVETGTPTTKAAPVVVTTEAAPVETEAPTTEAAPVVVTTEAATVETGAPTTKAAPVVVTTEAATVETEAPTTKAAPVVVATEAAPVETEAPTTKAAPVVVTTEAAPVETEAPTTAAAPVVVTTEAATVETGAPTTKAAPVVVTTEAATVETEAPTTKAAPVVVATEAGPVEIEAPTTKSAPVVVTTEAAPVETEAPTTKAAPVVVTTEAAPVETEAPTTEAAPVVLTTEAAPVETESPTTKAAAPVIVATEAALVETGAPTTKAAPVVVTTEAAPLETEEPATKAAPVVVTTEAAPVETEAPTTKAAPIETEAPTTKAAPIETEAPTTKAAAPVVVTTEAAPVETEAPTTKAAPETAAATRLPVVPSTLHEIAIDRHKPGVLSTKEPVVKTKAPAVSLVEKDVGNVICPFGHQANINGVCEDVDECTEGSHSCLDDQICINVQGGHRCACKRGFRMRDGDRKCVDVDECRTSMLLCQQDCVNTVGSYRCSCRSGYILKPDKRSCMEDARTSQNNMVGREARVLYARPIRCFNFKGSTFCRCPDSYKWNRFAMRCEKSIVVPNAIKQKVISPNPTMCFMFIGTRMCRCPRGYKWDLNMQHCKLASAITESNEVGFKKGPETKKESDVFSKKDTVPKTTAAAIVTTSAPCPPYFARTCSHKCTTVNGMHLCSCPAGYDKLYHGYCRDIDECRLGQHGCTSRESCFNTYGSYRCTDFSCPEGFLHYGKRFCRKPCKRRPTGPNDYCTDQYVAFLQYAVPKGTKTDSLLTRLHARNMYGATSTQFYFKTGQSYFKINKFGFFCALYVGRNLIYPGDYSVELVGDVMNSKGHLLCRTTFKILVNVGNYGF